MFKGLFKRPAISFDSSFTELHSHLIPGIDDGVKDIQESLDILASMEQRGIRKVITTPHILPGFYENTPDIIMSGLAEVQQAVLEAGMQIEVKAAAEYYIDDEFLKRTGTKDLLTFGKNYLLFELPVFNQPHNLDESLFELRSAGYKPVLAHPERYAFLFDGTMKKFERLKDSELLFQVNLFSFTGYYSSLIRQIARNLVDAGYVDLIGSDIHNRRQLKVLDNSLTDKWTHRLFKSGQLLNDSL